MTLEGPVKLFSASWSLFRSAWKKLVPIVLLPSICTAIAAMLFLTPLFPLGIISEIAGVILAIAMQPAAIDAIRRLSSDPSALVPIRTQYRLGFSMFWSVLLLAIMQGFFILGSTVLLVIPGVFVAVSAAFYLFARVLDGRKGFDAFTESFRIVRGRWWKTLGRFLFLAVIYVIAAVVISLIAAVLSAGSVDARSLWSMFVSLILQLVLSAVLGTVALIYLYRMYVSLKATAVPDKGTGAFKNWLVAFMVIGIVSLVLLPVLSLVTLAAFLHQPLVDQGTVVTMPLDKAALPPIR